MDAISSQSHADQLGAYIQQSQTKADHSVAVLKKSQEIQTQQGQAAVALIESVTQLFDSRA